MILQLMETQRRIFRAFTAQASLPLYELERTHVQKKHSRIRPFLRQRGFTKDPLCPQANVKPDELNFDGWRLAHAVKKAECLRQMPFEFIQRLGFILEHLPTLDWRRGNLRLQPGVARAYADFAGSSLAGRIGQGIALLFMEAREYAFAAHYPRAAGTPGPDFIFEKIDREDRALVEAKGAFVAPDVQPNIKSTLADGLHQLSLADPLGSKKSYVVGSFLRENGDQAEELSLVAFVDPDLFSSSDESPRDLVVRHNYAAWLDAMHLHYAASDLRTRTHRDHPEPVRLHVVNLNGTAFGVVPIDAFLPYWFDESFQLWPSTNGRLVVAGLPMRILARIGSALASPSSALTIAEVSLISPFGPYLESPFKGSVLRDGSLLGSLPARVLVEAPLEEIRL